MADNLKIAIVVYTLSSGGLERTVSNQTFLFEKMGYTIDLYVLEGEIDYSYSGNLFLFSLHKTNKIKEKIKQYNRLRALIQKGDYDFIVDHRYRLNNFMEKIWYSYIYKNQTLVYMVHSSDISSYISNYLAKKQIHWICVSNALKDILKKYYPKVKATTIYNFVQLEDSGKYQKNTSPPYILAVGRMDNANTKQFDVLIDCYAKSELPLRNIHLYILGSGERKTFLQSKAHDYFCSNLIHFKGFETDLRPYYSNAKFLVLCSKYEGLGMVLVESLICGTPVISYNCPVGPNEIIHHEYNGLLVENQNTEKLIHAMNRFVWDQELYKYCKKNAANSVDRFSSNKVAEVWEKFFNDIR